MQAALLAVLLICPAVTSAETGPVPEPAPDLREVRGPLRVRNYFPLNALFLGFDADDQARLAPGQIEFDLHYTLANSFARSSNIMDGMSDDERRPLTRQVFMSVIARNPDSDEFLVDLESNRISLETSLGVLPRLQLEASVPYVVQGGGMLDGLIEGFHDTFGLTQAGRDQTYRNSSTVALSFDDEQLYYAGFSNQGLGDVSLAARLTLIEGPGPIAPLSLKAAVKAPTGDEERLMGSGSWDYGLNLRASRMFRRNALHANIGMVVPGEWKLFPGLDLNTVYSILAAWEFMPRRGFSIILQDLAETPLFGKVTRGELADFSHEVSLGFKLDVGRRASVSFAVTENHQKLNNSPDISIHTALSFRCCGSSDGASSLR